MKNSLFTSTILSLLVGWSVHAELPKVEKNQPLPSNIFIELAKKINPAVVNISTSQLPQGSPFQQGDPREEFFRFFFGPQFNAPQQQPRQSLGTGFIIRSDGLILTNNHVVDNADVIKVQLEEGGKLYDAKIVGKDERTDIALIKIESKEPLPTAELGNSSELEVGEWVAAFGNPYGHGHTMTKGIISAKGRNIDELNRFSFLQTDASINPGNSGGPLVNLQGKVVGVNAAIDARAQGIGFAIPIDDVKTILPILEKGQHIARGYLGVGLQQLNDEVAEALNLSKDLKGAFVAHVYPDSPAEKAGLKPYDVITKVGKKIVNDHTDLIHAIQNLAVGQKIEVSFIRNGQPKSKIVNIEQHPDDLKILAQNEKSYKGQKAPFSLGFKISDWSTKLKKEYDLPSLRSKKPIVIEVNQGSAAAASGIAPGDVILDINRQPVTTAQDVIRTLKKGKLNILRVLKGSQVVLIQLVIK